MPLPVPHPGLVIRYSYLWADEAQQGRESGSKDRPCAIVLARQVTEGQTVVTVVPVTHVSPSSKDEAIEIPITIKRLLGLDDERSWIVVSEVNDFLWPGPDLVPLPESAPTRFDYGTLPPTFFRGVRNRIVALARERRLRHTARTV